MNSQQVISLRQKWNVTQRNQRSLQGKEGWMHCIRARAAQKAPLKGRCIIEWRQQGLKKKLTLLFSKVAESFHGGRENGMPFRELGAVPLSIREDGFHSLFECWGHGEALSEWVKQAWLTVLHSNVWSLKKEEQTASAHFVFVLISPFSSYFPRRNSLVSVIVNSSDPAGRRLRALFLYGNTLGLKWMDVPAWWHKSQCPVDKTVIVFFGFFSFWLPNQFNTASIFWFAADVKWWIFRDVSQ